MNWSSSQGSIGEMLSQKSEPDEEMSSKVLNKIKSMVKTLIVPCLTHLYPNSSLREIKFQDPSHKGMFYLESVNCSSREERIETLPEIPEELSTKLRLHIKQMKLKRSSSSNIQFNRSKKISNLSEEQVQTLDRLCIELISGVNRHPDTFDKVVSIITELIHTIHSNTSSLPNILDKINSLNQKNNN